MRIIFDLHNVGLGNNGGSRTLIKCGEALTILGHEVIIHSNVPCKYNWHKPKGIQIIKGNKIPKGNVVIATGAGSYDHTLSVSHIKKKFVYIRGWEIWCTSAKKLIRSYKHLKCIVNSEWLQKRLKKHNIKSTIVYPGIDFDKFFEFEKTKRDGVGAIYHQRHKTKRHIDAIALQKKGIKVSYLNKDIVNPSEEKLNIWYNKLKVWFTPTELEGLHNPPQEASLAGCALVVTDHPKSGTSDYAIPNETALVYPRRNINMAEKMIRKLLEDEKERIRLKNNMKKLLLNKIGTRIENMEKFVQCLKKM